MNRRTYQLEGEPNNSGGATAQDLAGYPDVGRLAQGYREAGSEAKRQRDRADLLEQQMTQLLTAANPPKPTPSGDPLEEYGLPAQVLRQEISKEIQRAFEPISRGVQARSRVLAEYPDYNKFESDVAAFIQSDPVFARRYENMFQADPEGAIELGLLKFTENRRRSSPGPNGRAESFEAQIPSNQQGGSRNIPDNSAVQQAWEQFQRTGSKEDAARYAKARLGTVIKDEFLNQ